MMKVIATMISVLISTLCAYSDDGDDTLRGYLSRSDLVVSGKITSKPFGVTSESGVLNYLCDYKIEDVLKGNADLKDKTIKVNIVRFELHAKDRHPLINQGSESILFLKKAKGQTPLWVTADFWFGVQHLSPWMARSLKRLEKK